MNPWELLAAQTAPVTPRPQTRKSRLAVGGRVGEWTLLEYWPGLRRQAAKWRCRCSCGNIRLVQSNNLLRGGSKNCGHTRQPKETS